MTANPKGSTASETGFPRASIPFLLVGGVFQGLAVSLAEHGYVLSAGCVVLVGALLIWLSGFIGGIGCVREPASAAAPTAPKEAG